jgi:hypothetical protein
MINKENVAKVHAHLLAQGVADVMTVRSDGKVFAEGMVEIQERPDVAAALATYVEPLPQPTMEERLAASEAALLELLLGG